MKKKILMITILLSCSIAIADPALDIKFLRAESKLLRSANYNLRNEIKILKAKIEVLKTEIGFLKNPPKVQPKEPNDGNTIPTTQASKPTVSNEHIEKAILKYIEINRSKGVTNIQDVTAFKTLRSEISTVPVKIYCKIEDVQVSSDGNITLRLYNISLSKNISATGYHILLPVKVSNAYAQSLKKGTVVVLTTTLNISSTAFPGYRRSCLYGVYTSLEYLMKDKNNKDFNYRVCYFYFKEKPSTEINGKRIEVAD